MARHRQLVQLRGAQGQRQGQDGELVVRRFRGAGGHQPVRGDPQHGGVLAQGRLPGGDIPGEEGQAQGAGAGGIQRVGERQRRRRPARVAEALEEGAGARQEKPRREEKAQEDDRVHRADRGRSTIGGARERLHQVSRGDEDRPGRSIVRPIAGRVRTRGDRDGGGDAAVRGHRPEGVQRQGPHLGVQPQGPEEPRATRQRTHRRPPRGEAGAHVPDGTGEQGPPGDARRARGEDWRGRLPPRVARRGARAEDAQGRGGHVRREGAAGGGAGRGGRPRAQGDALAGSLRLLPHRRE